MFNACGKLFRLLHTRWPRQWVGSGIGKQGRKEQWPAMERYIMELRRLQHKMTYRNERGMSLIELMIAMVVLLVGVVGSMALIAYAIGGNGRSRQQSNATVIAQMVSEKISSQKASLSHNLTLTHCPPPNTPAYPPPARAP